MKPARFAVVLLLLLAATAGRAAVFDYTHTSGTVTGIFTGTTVTLSISGSNSLNVPSTAAQDLSVRNGIVSWSSGSTVHSYVFDQTRNEWKGSSRPEGPTSDLSCADGVVAWSSQAGTVYFRVYDPLVGYWVFNNGTGSSGVLVLNKHGVVAWRTPTRVNYYVYDPTRTPGWRQGGMNISSGAFDLQTDGGVVAWSSNPRVDYQVYDPRQGAWIGGNVPNSGFTATLNVQNSQVTWTSTGQDPFFRGYNPNTRSWGASPVPMPYFAAHPVSGNAPFFVSFIDMSIGGTSWSLDFGDGTGSALKRATTHRYTAFGRLTATQTVNGFTTNRFIITDTIAPTGTNRINNGATFTTNALVTLNPTAADNSGLVTHMRFSNAGTNWSDWEAFGPAKTWTLSPSNGTKTVSAQFRDAALNTSAVANASILLDTSPLPVISLINTNVQENPATVTLAAVLDHTYSQPVVFSFTTSNGTATAGSDYDTRGGTLTFPPNTRSTSFTLNIRGDSLAELNETVLIHFTAISNGVPGVPGVVTILDDDVAQVSFAQTNYSVYESNLAVITVQLSAPSGRSVSVGFMTTNGTATADLDYAPAQGSVNFPPGVTNATFNVVLNNDPLDEFSETIELRLVSAIDAVLVEPTRATLTILDDDNPLVFFSSRTYTVTENAGLAEIQVWLSKPFTKPVRVRYSTTAGGTAIPGFGNDYVAVSDDLEFSTDPLSPEATNQFFYVNLVNDSVPELIKTIHLRLSNFRDGNPGPATEADIILIDDDAPPQLTLPTLTTNNQLKITLQGKPGQRFRIEHSSNMVSWTEVTTLINTTGTLEYLLPVTTDSLSRFYRTRLLP